MASPDFPKSRASARLSVTRSKTHRPVLDLRRRFRLLVYRVIFRWFPLKHQKVVFDSFWGTEVGCNPYFLYRRLVERGDYLCIWPLTTGAKHRSLLSRNAATTIVTHGSLAHFWHLATAKYLVTNINPLNEYIKRDGAVVLQTQHGTPLKFMGLDMRPIREHEMNWEHFARRCGTWDYVLSSNPHSSGVWQRAMPYRYEILETGYPRNDEAFHYGEEDCDALRRELGIPPGRKVALYAPTYRAADQIGTALDEAALAAALGQDWSLVTRFHYLERCDKRLPPGVIDVSDYPLVNHLFRIVDLLITDYSSVMFDFALFGRPIVLFVPDLEDYRQTRGLYFDVREKGPGFVAETAGELLQGLRDRVFDQAENRAKLEAFRDEFCPWDDGGATDRVIARVFAQL
jgi:CDP-glycerol glycerophosphotransferase